MNKEEILQWPVCSNCKHWNCTKEFCSIKKKNKIGLSTCSVWIKSKKSYVK